MTAKHYGIVDEIAQHEPDGAIGNLSISSVLADSVHAPASLVVVGSTTDSAVNLAQLVLTAEQAIKLGALIVSAGQESLAADRDVENLRRHGASAARLCFALAEADAVDVLADQSRVRLGYPLEAQLLAEQAYGDVDYSGDWREAWREAGERLTAQLGHVDDVSRCAVCGWKLRRTAMEGCIRGNCSQRPRPANLYAPVRAAKEGY